MVIFSSSMHLLSRINNTAVLPWIRYVDIAGGGGFVESADGGGAWGGMEGIGLRIGEMGDLDHGGDKGVEGFLAFGFGWFDHHGFFDGRWEIDGRRVEAGVDEGFGDVEGADLGIGLARSGKHTFVFTDLGIRQVVILSEFDADIVGVEDGIFRNAEESFAAQHEDIDIGLEDDGEVAVEGGHISDRFGPIVLERIPRAPKGIRRRSSR